jgi:hypothetical protein
VPRCIALSLEVTDRISSVPAIFDIPPFVFELPTAPQGVLVLAPLLEIDVRARGGRVDTANLPGSRAVFVALRS